MGGTKPVIRPLSVTKSRAEPEIQWNTRYCIIMKEKVSKTQTVDKPRYMSSRAKAKPESRDLKR